MQKWRFDQRNLRLFGVNVIKMLVNYSQEFQKQQLIISKAKCQEEEDIFAKKHGIIETQMDLYIKALLNKDKNVALSRGCTACVCVVDNKTKKMYFANAGDSRVILCKNGKAFRISIDHKPELELENNSIHKAEGWVNSYGGINGNLNLSRC